jgi:DNA processing protein
VTDLVHLTPLDHNYPPRLRSLPDPPASITVSGGAVDSTRTVAVVGSRQAVPDALHFAKDLALELTKAGVVVVSGGAEGIDRAAHEGAIMAGGRTIAVLGTALDEVFPKENADLQEQIGREHLLVSQFPSGQPTSRKNFPIRNRTMALLTDATVIVEAGEKSGTRHQGWECLRLGRILFLVENVANNPDLTWPQEMIGYGAQVLSRANLDVVIENLPTLASDGDIAAEA